MHEFQVGIPDVKRHGFEIAFREEVFEARVVPFCLQKSGDFIGLPHRLRVLRGDVK